MRNLEGLGFLVVKLLELLGYTGLDVLLDEPCAGGVGLVGYGDCVSRAGTNRQLQMRRSLKCRGGSKRANGQIERGSGGLRTSGLDRNASTTSRETLGGPELVLVGFDEYILAGRGQRDLGGNGCSYAFH